MALGDGHMSFNETALAANTDGHVIALMRWTLPANENAWKRGVTSHESPCADHKLP